MGIISLTDALAGLTGSIVVGGDDVTLPDLNVGAIAGTSASFAEDVGAQNITAAVNLQSNDTLMVAGDMQVDGDINTDSAYRLDGLMVLPYEASQLYTDPNMNNAVTNIDVSNSGGHATTAFGVINIAGLETDEFVDTTNTANTALAALLVEGRDYNVRLEIANFSGVVGVAVSLNGGDFEDVNPEDGWVEVTVTAGGDDTIAVRFRGNTDDPVTCDIDGMLVREYQTDNITMPAHLNVDFLGSNEGVSTPLLEMTGACEISAIDLPAADPDVEGQFYQTAGAVLISDGP